ncbi:hypothetical protein [Pseudomonas sp. Pseu.R1]|uniref:hypothetical protein n=1 Tax=Pseudomonas sp. Pseu.R1 TaxID=3379818 RepID=UPI003B923E23
MKDVLTINHTSERSIDIRARREISLNLDPSEGTVQDITQAEHVLIVGDHGIPYWVAKIEHFSISPGSNKKHITIRLGKLVSLFESFAQVSKHIQNHRLTHAKITKMDVEALFRVGTLITASEDVSFSALTANEAATRLAWTYGVAASQVEISIKL